MRAVLAVVLHCMLVDRTEYIADEPAAAAATRFGPFETMACPASPVAGTMDQVRPHVAARRRIDDRGLIDWPTCSSSYPIRWRPNADLDGHRTDKNLAHTPAIRRSGREAKSENRPPRSAPQTSDRIASSPVYACWSVGVRAPHCRLAQERQSNPDGAPVLKGAPFSVSAVSPSPMTSRAISG